MSLDPKTKMQALYMFLGTIHGVHERLDDLREQPKDSLGGMAYPSDGDYNIEMAQQSLEVASMRLQQVLFHTDPEICDPSDRRCSDETGPCKKHEGT